MIILKIKQ